jgi:hypothetical protein
MKKFDKLIIVLILTMTCSFDVVNAEPKPLRVQVGQVVHQVGEKCRIVFSNDGISEASYPAYFVVRSSGSDPDKYVELAIYSKGFLSLNGVKIPSGEMYVDLKKIHIGQSVIFCLTGHTIKPDIYHVETLRITLNKVYEDDGSVVISAELLRKETYPVVKG